MGFISVVPALAMICQMDRRGKIVNISCMVCSAPALAAHFGFAMGTEPLAVIPLLAAKCIGVIAGICVALIFTKERISERKTA